MNKTIQGPITLLKVKFKMNTLPIELVSKIGNFLERGDLANAHVASHVFDSLSFDSTFHYLKCSASDYVSKFQNIDAIMSYLKKIKPLLENTYLLLKDLPEEAHRFVRDHVFQYPFYEVRLIHCFDLNMMFKFSNVHRFVIALNDNTYYPYHFFDTIANNDNIILTSFLIYDRHLPLLYHPCMKKVQRLKISVQSYATIDLSRIEDSTKIDLNVVNTTYTIRVLDAYKVTNLSIYVENILSYWMAPLLSSFISDPRIKDTKLEHVNIFYLNINKEVGMWYDFVRAMPKTVIYTFGSVNDPNIIPFMRRLKSLGVKKMRLNVTDESSYRQARLVQLLENDYELYFSKGYDATRVYTSVCEIYNDMTEDEKLAWYWLGFNLNGMCG